MLALQTKNYASSAAVTLLLTAGCLVLLGEAAIGGLAASLIRNEEKKRVGCFLQAGNLAGGALAGGGLLMLAIHVSKLTLGMAAAALVLAPALLVLRVERLRQQGAGSPLPQKCC